MTGFGIAVRNTAESKWKADIRKLKRQEAQLRDQLASTATLRSQMIQKKMSKREHRMLAEEDEKLDQLDAVVDGIAHDVDELLPERLPA